VSRQEVNVCDAPHEEQTFAVGHLRLDTDDRQVDMDLCSDHLSKLLEVGIVTVQGPGPVRKGKPTCAECRRSFASPQGLALHGTRTGHKVA
jgi:hypothetical protein